MPDATWCADAADPAVVVDEIQRLDPSIVWTGQRGRAERWCDSSAWIVRLTPESVITNPVLDVGIVTPGALDPMEQALADFEDWSDATGASHDSRAQALERELVALGATWSMVRCSEAEHTCGMWLVDGNACLFAQSLLIGPIADFDVSIEPTNRLFLRLAEMFVSATTPE